MFYYVLAFDSYCQCSSHVERDGVGELSYGGGEDNTVISHVPCVLAHPFPYSISHTHNEGVVAVKFIIKFFVTLISAASAVAGVGVGEEVNADRVVSTDLRGTTRGPVSLRTMMRVQS